MLGQAPRTLHPSQTDGALKAESQGCQALRGGAVRQVRVRELGNFAKPWGWHLPDSHLSWEELVGSESGLEEEQRFRVPLL